MDHVDTREKDNLRKQEPSRKIGAESLGPASTWGKRERTRFNIRVDKEPVLAIDLLGEQWFDLSTMDEDFKNGIPNKPRRGLMLAFGQLSASFIKPTKEELVRRRPRPDVRGAWGHVWYCINEIYIGTTTKAREITKKLVGSVKSAKERDDFEISSQNSPRILSLSMLF